MLIETFTCRRCGDFLIGYIEGFSANEMIRLYFRVLEHVILLGKGIRGLKSGIYGLLLYIVGIVGRWFT